MNKKRPGFRIRKASIEGHVAECFRHVSEMLMSRMFRVTRIAHAYICSVPDPMRGRGAQPRFPTAHQVVHRTYVRKYVVK